VPCYGLGTGSNDSRNNTTEPLDFAAIWLLLQHLVHSRDRRPANVFVIVLRKLSPRAVVTATVLLATASLASAGVDRESGELSARVEVVPPAAPTNLVATPGSARVTLTWTAVSGATSYRVFRTTTGTFGSSPLTTVTTPTYTNFNLTNGTAYSYRVVARNADGDSPPSETVAATPIAVPGTPTGVTAAGGDRQVTVSWSGVPLAASYRIYRSLTSGSFSSTPNATVTAPVTSYVDTGLENGPIHYYTVIAVNVSGSSSRSAQASAYTEAPRLVVDAATQSAFRLLRQATWGPRPGDVDHVKAIGRDAFIAEQLAAPMSAYPDELIFQNTDAIQQHVFRLALTGPDQLRQRVAWALHKMWVVSANDAIAARGLVAYQRLLLQHAFGNYRDLMEAITLTPSMGQYLTMLNNRSEQVTGAPANENYARELMQLFTIGTAQLAPDGTPIAGPPPYSEGDVIELARIFTGWTYGDGNPGTIPMALAEANYMVPMEAVAAFHDPSAKTFLGEDFPAGASAVADLDHALDVLFNHPNVGPFVAGQLIKQLVLSNPTPAYVRDVAAVFNNNGAGVRGDMAAVVRAILTHPEASATGPAAGKFAEPLLFVVSLLRSLDAITPDMKLLVDRTQLLGQRVLYPPSVFSYFSPRFGVRGTVGADGALLTGPELQIHTGTTALERANFVGRLLGGFFGDALLFDFSPYWSRARDAAALVDYCNLQFMAGRMTTQERTEMIETVRATGITSITERSRSALYLTLVIAHSQVDR
jgi:uncharacterized protein (DUF1800 family)/fibronectin type 3 domain-containing protein